MLSRGGRRILAIGGHEFDRRAGNEAICDLIVRLAGSAQPRICLLPTASGDPEDQIARFRRAFGERDCEPSEISLFRLGTQPVELRDELLSQDAIYVGGGSMVNLLAVWRAHELDAIMAEAWEAGVLLCGQSAGAMCWFEHGITSSSGEPAVAAGLGLLPGSACVHYGAEATRRHRFLAAVSEGLSGGLGLEDQTAALFEERQLSEAYSARDGARVWRVGRNVRKVTEEALPATRLEDPRPPIDHPRSEVIELRETLASRAAHRHSGGGRLGRTD
jgi:dipeptidase E